MKSFGDGETRLYPLKMSPLSTFCTFCCCRDKHLGAGGSVQSKIFKIIIPTYFEFLLTSRVEKVHADIMFTNILSSPKTELTSESDPEYGRASQNKSEIAMF